MQNGVNCSRKKKIKVLQTEKLKLLVLTVLAASFAIALSWTGMLQRFEWMLLDTYFILRPAEAAEKRIVVVGLTEKDIQELRTWPVSDKQLAQLLNIIKRQRPRAIGLDVYRDLPVEPGYQELVKVFKTTPELTGVQKVIGNSSGSSVSPPPLLEDLGQISTIDLVVDRDTVLRRGMLVLPREGKPSIPSLGLALALKFLEKQGIKPEFDNKNNLKLNDAFFPIFRENDGGYVRADAGGYQIILNYRNYPGVQRVSFSDVLNNRISHNVMRDKIVIVGSTAASAKDQFYTPFSNLNNYFSTSPIATFGVEIQAQIASQVISAALDKRPSIKVLDDSLENCLVFVTSLLFVVISFALTFYKRNFNSNKKSSAIFILLLGVIFNITILSGGYLAFLSSFWIPVFPSLIVLNISALVFISYTDNKTINTTYYKLKQTNQNFALALDATCTGILNYNLSTNQISIDRNCDRLFGWEASSYFGDLEDFVQHIHQEDRHKIIEILKSRSSFELKFRFILPRKNISWLYIKGEPYSNAKGVEEVIATITNITVTEKALQSLAKEIAFRNAITSNTIDIVFTLNNKLVIESCTPSVQPNFGYFLSEVIDQDILEFIHPEDSERVLESLTEILHDPTQIVNSTFRFQHMDGTWYWVESTGYLDKNSAGGVILTVHHR